MGPSFSELKTSNDPIAWIEKNDGNCTLVFDTQMKTNNLKECGKMKIIPNWKNCGKSHWNQWPGKNAGDERGFAAATRPKKGVEGANWNPHGKTTENLKSESQSQQPAL